MRHLCTLRTSQVQVWDEAFLYHKADVEGIKADLLNFQNSFLQQNPSLIDVEVMWNDFKEAVYNTISKHVPQRTI